MANIFYYGSDGKVYGPETELTVQGWYANGFLSSDVKFQISQSKQPDPNGPFLSLGDLIDLNGRTLPFHFSVERANQARKQEDTINQLKQEVESLRTFCKDIQKNQEKSDDKETISGLQSQVASLVATQSDLLRRLDALSSQKETSPVPAQLEKKVVEVKKRVDEQEKSITSMKKEISAVTSKCDRSDAKLDKLAEKQKEAEGSTDGYDKRISDLKASEESLRESISSCEQKVTSTADQIDSLKNDLSEIRKELEEQNKKQKFVAVNNIVAVNEAAEMHAEEEDDVPPWEKEDKGSSGKEKADEQEPWNKINQKESDAAPVKTENAVVGVEPKSKTKNWDAICKELSDDEAVEEEKHGNVVAENGVIREIRNREVHVRAENLLLIDLFMDIFRVYLQAMRTKRLDTLPPLAPDAIIVFSKTFLEWKSSSDEFLPLAKILLDQLPVLCDEWELICWECPCRIFTPVNLLDHLVLDDHFEKMQKIGPNVQFHAMAVQRVFGKLSLLLKRTSPCKRESLMNTKGEQMFKNVKEAAQLRPTRDFVRAKMQQYLNLACAGDRRAIGLANKGGQLDPEDDDYFWRIIRKWFKVERNQWKFLDDLDEHISTGIPHCSECKVAFESKSDFYKHVTGYIHARKDQRMFCGCMIRLARGTRDWDITM